MVSTFHIEVVLKGLEVLNKWANNLFSDPTCKQGITTSLRCAHPLASFVKAVAISPMHHFRVKIAGLPSTTKVSVSSRAGGRRRPADVCRSRLALGGGKQPL